MNKFLEVQDAEQLALLRQWLAQGGELTLTRDHVPLAKLLPLMQPEKKLPRVTGLNPGNAWMAADFNDELPDEFWGI